MREVKVNSFNHEVFKKAYKRLNLSPTTRIVFQRLLGFLIRNNKPFPYSAPKMAEITGFSLRTIFNSFNDLEKYRLIKRIGMGKNRKFCSGTMLLKIFTTVQNRYKITQHINKTTVQLTTQKSDNRATGAYNKTSLSLKRKERELINNNSKPKKIVFNESQQSILHDKKMVEYQKAIEARKKMNRS